MNLRRSALGLTLLAGYSLSSVLIAQDTASKPVAQQIPVAWPFMARGKADRRHARMMRMLCGSMTFVIGGPNVLSVSDMTVIVMRTQPPRGPKPVSSSPK